MALGRYVVDAVVLEGRNPAELAKAHGISRRWVYALVGRYRAGGYPALEPRSRRPKSCPHQHGPAVEAAILALRRSLTDAGHDAGAQTIAHHLAGTVVRVPAVSTIWKILRRHGLITPEPHKRPRASFIRFEAALPNELWQTDATHWQLADRSPVEIRNMEDDHSRLLVASVAFRTVKAADVVTVFAQAGGECGYPAALLSDNAAVFSGASRRGKVLIESELERLGIRCIHSTPYHPQTCGTVERFPRPSRSTWPSRLRRSRSATCSCSSTPTAPPTTSTARTARSVDARRWSRSPRGSKRDRPNSRRRCTSGSERTASTPVGRSPCAPTASSGTSRSAEPTSTNRSGCSSPMTTSGSSARTAHCSASSPSIRAATTSHSIAGSPAIVHDVGRQVSSISRDTTRWARRDSNPHALASARP